MDMQDTVSTRYLLHNGLATVGILQRMKRRNRGTLVFIYISRGVITSDRPLPVCGGGVSAVESATL